MSEDWNPSPPSSGFSCSPGPDTPLTSNSAEIDHSSFPPPINEGNSLPKGSEEASRNRDKYSSKNEDRIGETVFSKAWVLSLLVRTVESVSLQQHACSVTGSDGDDSAASLVPFFPESMESSERSSMFREGSKYTGSPRFTGSPKSDEGSNFSRPESTLNELVNGDGSNVRCVDGNDGGIGEVTMDAGLEEELCMLWDASINSDVAHFLSDQNAVDLLLGVADRTQSFRVTEICIGMLGNLACVPAICAKSLCCHSTIERLLHFLTITDPRVLTETTRCLSLCFVHQEARVVLLEPDQNLADFILQIMTFILQSSTNDDLLRNTSSLLDCLLDNCEHLLAMWACREDLVESICEGIKQTCSSSEDTVGSLLVTLQLITTREEGVRSVVSQKDKVLYHTLRYLRNLECLDKSNCLTVLAVITLHRCVHKNMADKRTQFTAMENDTREILQRLLSQVGRLKEDHEPVLYLTELKESLTEALGCVVNVQKLVENNYT